MIMSRFNAIGESVMVAARDIANVQLLFLMTGIRTSSPRWVGALNSLLFPCSNRAD